MRLKHFNKVAPRLTEQNDIYQLKFDYQLVTHLFEWFISIILYNRINSNKIINTN